MRFRRFLIRNANAPDLIELFLIASVVSVLAIRTFLAASGYPQIGGDGLHVAHMLWGGLFMMLALLILFSFLGRMIQRLAAILAGVGFGTFIDELGKFITSDNNYFFQPTIGIIYVIFISLFLLLRAFRNQQIFTTGESLANALNHLEDVSAGSLDAKTRRDTLEELEKADPDNQLVQTLKAYVGEIDPSQVSDMSLYFRVRDRFLRGYSRVVLHRWF